MQLLSDLHLAPHGRLCLSETTSSRSHKGADMMYNQTQHRHLVRAVSMAASAMPAGLL